MNKSEDLKPNDSPRHGSLHSHVAILFDGIMYDSDGEMDARPISEHVSVKAMELALLNNTCWNGAFKRANDGDKAGAVSKLKSFYHNLFDIHLGEHACLR